MSHTPGPWSPYFYVRNQRLRLGEWRFMQAESHQPVQLNGTRKDVPEPAANARLIAAAPDLLAAAKLALESGDQQYVKFILRDAIAKAERRE